MAPLTLGGGEIIRIKFVEDGTLLLLWKEGGAEARSRLISVPYLSHHQIRTNGDDGGTGTGEIPFTPTFAPVKKGEPVRGQKAQSVFQNDQQRAALTRHTFFNDEQQLEPIEIEVNGRRGRRVVCVLFSDRSKYAVYDMDSFDEQPDERVDDEAQMPPAAPTGDLVMSEE